MKVQMSKTIRYKTGVTLTRGQVVEVEGPARLSPKYDRAHYKATREHRWNDEPTYTVQTTNGLVAVWASDVAVIAPIARAN